jgi:hypothetical protein
MILMNLTVALVAGMILFEPFSRVPESRFVGMSARRSCAHRSFLQAAIAFFAAMMVATSQPAPERVSPLLVFAIAFLLALAGVYWLLRGKRLLKPRRMFSQRY